MSEVRAIVKRYGQKPDSRVPGRQYHLGVALNSEEMQFVINASNESGTFKSTYLRDLIHKEMKRGKRACKKDRMEVGADGER